jgi:predicted dehydrogenase
MADQLRIAVLGMAHDHLWAKLEELTAREDAELVGAADLNPALRQHVTERRGCDKAYL